MKTFWKVFAVILIISLTAGDIITSQYIFSSGFGIEGNPIVINMIDFFGDFWWMPKLFASIIMSIIVYDMWNKKGWQKHIVRFLVVIYTIFYISLISYHIALISIANVIKV